jgi:hypothetical protein
MIYVILILLSEFPELKLEKKMSGVRDVILVFTSN